MSTRLEMASSSAITADALKSPGEVVRPGNENRTGNGAAKEQPASSSILRGLKLTVVLLTQLACCLLISQYDSAHTGKGRECVESLLSSPVTIGSVGEDWVHIELDVSPTKR
jgi:hypothetical protein